MTVPPRLIVLTATVAGGWFARRPLRDLFDRARRGTAVRSVKAPESRHGG
ncbi:MAG: hypothetical protein ABWX74_13440 [Aeromicrobium sp.]